MYKRNIKGWAKHLDFIILDCLMLAVSFVIAYFVRIGVDNPFVNDAYREIFFVIILTNFLVILFLDTMKNVLKRGYYREFTSTLTQAVVLLMCVSTYMFSVKNSEMYSRITIYLTVVIFAVLTFLVRILWKKHLLNKLKNKKKTALLVMASEDIISDIVKRLKEQNFDYHSIVGLVVSDADRVGKSIDDIPVVAAYNTIQDYATNHWVDEVLVCTNPNDEVPEDIIYNLTQMGVTVHFTFSNPINQFGFKQVAGRLGGLFVITSSMNYITPRQYLLKRAMDIVGGLVGCIITGILYIILAPLIKIASPGPVFFTQERVGRNGKPFKIYKFRSMYMDAEERKAELMSQNRLNNNLMFKMDFDPRIIGNRIDKDGNRKTGIGDFIRKYSLDEFPQFYNVLKGDMSLVGTRPPLFSEYAEYSAHHKARLAARPGITGLWQVSGRSDILDFDEVVKLDTEYINNWSVGLDLKILFKTILVVVGKEGSM